MFTSAISLASALLLLSAPFTSAQTTSSCNPTQGDICPAVDAFPTSTTVYDWTGLSGSDVPGNWTFNGSGELSYDAAKGMGLTIAKRFDAPVLESNLWIWYGNVKATIKPAAGTGIVSSFILLSDVLDEIDWEWCGGDDYHSQSNFFWQADTSTGWTRGGLHDVGNSVSEYHTFEIDWTPERIEWIVDGTVYRTLTSASCTVDDTVEFPQTPSQIKIGNWAGGDPDNAEGTIEWAGGETDYTDAPFTMYVKDITVVDYSSARTFSYSGTSGMAESILIDGEETSAMGGEAVSAAHATTTARAAATTGGSTTTSGGLVTTTTTSVSGTVSSGGGSTGFVTSTVKPEPHVAYSSGGASVAVSASAAAAAAASGSAFGSSSSAKASSAAKVSGIAQNSGALENHARVGAVGLLAGLLGVVVSCLV
ncbi:transglycosylase [Saitoella coloradoensis]